MGSVDKTANGRHKARFRDPHGRSRSRTFDRKSDAVRFLASVETDMGRGEWIDHRDGQVRFDQWAVQHLGSKLHLRESGRARDESYLRNHVLPAFGTMRLGAISPIDVQTWVTELSRGPLAPRTVRECYRIFGSAMKAAVHARVIRESPCVGISLPRVEHEEQRFLTADEVRRLADAIEGRYSALILSAAFLGCRWGELVGLKRSNLNLLRREVRIVGTLEEVNGSLRYVEDTKSSASRRTVSIPPFLVDALSRHLLAAQVNDFVFTASNGSLLRRSNFRRRSFKPALEKAELDRGVRFHDLRHTCAALLIAGNANPLEVQRRLGHRDIKTTLSLYGHLYADSDDRIASVLQGAFEGASEGLESLDRREVLRNG